jgi:hypothetical protein
LSAEVAPARAGEAVGTLAATGRTSDAFQARANLLLGGQVLSLVAAVAAAMVAVDAGTADRATLLWAGGAAAGVAAVLWCSWAHSRFTRRHVAFLDGELGRAMARLALARGDGDHAR